MEALAEYVPTACEFLSMGSEGRTAFLLQEAAKAFRDGNAKACQESALQCAAAAWQLLLSGSPTEALLHAHALAHAMLADLELDAQQAMIHADLSLSLCPDLPIAALHTVMKACNRRCQEKPIPQLQDGLSWEIPGQLPSTPKTPVLKSPMERFASATLSVAQFREACLKVAVPAVIEGHLDCAGWRVKSWGDLRFWLRHGHRTIPIEMGFHEGDEQSTALQSSVSEGSVRLGDFVRNYLAPSNAVFQSEKSWAAAEPIDEWSASQVAYMAQHQLFLQIPELRHVSFLVFP